MDSRVLKEYLERNNFPIVRKRYHKYLTFEVDNLKDFLYTAQIEYTEGSFASDWRTDRSSSDLISSKLGFDTSDIIELPESFENYKDGGVNFDFVSH